MRPPPRKFATDYECLDFLNGINPEYEDNPEEFDYAAAIQNAIVLRERFKEAFGAELNGIHMDFQDATCHAKFYIEPDILVTLSNFEKLAAVSEIEPGPDSKLPAILAALEECGYTYVPYRVAHLSEDDLVRQLFDYV